MKNSNIQIGLLGFIVCFLITILVLVSIMYYNDDIERYGQSTEALKDDISTLATYLMLDTDADLTRFKDRSRSHVIQDKRKQRFIKIYPTRNETKFYDKLRANNHFVNMTADHSPLYIVLEDVGKSINFFDELPEDTLDRLKQIKQELKEQGIQHNDLKPGNICYNPETDKFTIIDCSRTTDNKFMNFFYKGYENNRWQQTLTYLKEKHNIY